MIRKVFRCTKTTVKLTAFCFAVKSIYDYRNNEENFLVKSFKQEKIYDLIGKADVKFDYLPVYQEIVKRLQKESVNFSFVKKILDVDKILSQHSEINKSLEKFHSLMTENMNLHRQKIISNGEDELKNLANINGIIDKTIKNNSNLHLLLGKSEKLLSEISLGLLEIYKKIDVDIEIITAYINNDDFYYHTKVETKIKELSNQFLEILNSFKLELVVRTGEEFGKVEILQKLNEISKLKERFLKEKLNLLERQENEYYDLFKDKFLHIELLVQDYKSVANLYKNELLNSFAIKNEISTNDLISNIDLKKTIDNLSEHKLNANENELLLALNQQLYNPSINTLNVIVNDFKNCFSLSNLNLKLEEDQEFIRKLSISHYRRYIMITNTIHNKFITNENPTNTENNSLIQNNRNHKSFSDLIGDEFSSNLLQKQTALVSNNGLMNEFIKVKNSIIFNLFSDKNSLYNFIFSSIVVKSSFIWFPYFYDENHNTITSKDNHIIKTLKELSLIENNIKQHKFIEAYQTCHNLKNYNEITRNLDHALRERIRYSFVVENLNSHLKFI